MLLHIFFIFIQTWGVFGGAMKIFTDRYCSTGSSALFAGGTIVGARTNTGCQLMSKAAGGHPIRAIRADASLGNPCTFYVYASTDCTGSTIHSTDTQSTSCGCLGSATVVGSWKATCAGTRTGANNKRDKVDGSVHDKRGGASVSLWREAASSSMSIARRQVCQLNWVANEGIYQPLYYVNNNPYGGWLMALGNPTERLDTRMEYIPTRASERAQILNQMILQQLGNSNTPYEVRVLHDGIEVEITTSSFLNGGQLTRWTVGQLFERVGEDATTALQLAGIQRIATARAYLVTADIRLVSPAGPIVASISISWDDEF